MWSILFKYLVEKGVTNLIEVDGMVYAPVVDLWHFFIRISVDGLAMAATVLVSSVALVWACQKIAGWFIRLIGDQNFDDHAPSGA